MPELPEVETVMRGLVPVLVGRQIVAVTLRRADLRFPFPPGFAENLQGATVTGLARRAKYILVNCDNAHTLLVHLGMTGRFSHLLANRDAANLGAFYFAGSGEQGTGPHDHVLVDLDDGSRLIYSDPRRFGMMDVFPSDQSETHVRLRHIGVEPLGNAFSGAHLAEQFRGSKAPLKAALLNQQVVAGLGNIYVNEALHRAGLLPTRAAGSLVKAKSHDARLDDLARHIRDILNDAIRAGGSTLQDFVGADGAEGVYQQHFAVYDRENAACPTQDCNGIIKRIVQSGRSTFFCSKCQK